MLNKSSTMPLNSRAPCVKLHLRDGQTDKEMRPFVRFVCQGRPSYEETKCDAS